MENLLEFERAKLLVNDLPDDFVGRHGAVSIERSCYTFANVCGKIDGGVCGRLFIWKLSAYLFFSVSALTAVKNSTHVTFGVFHSMCEILFIALHITCRVQKRDFHSRKTGTYSYKLGMLRGVSNPATFHCFIPESPSTWNQSGKFFTGSPLFHFLFHSLRPSKSWVSSQARILPIKLAPRRLIPSFHRLKEPQLPRPSLFDLLPVP